MRRPRVIPKIKQEDANAITMIGIYHNAKWRRKQSTHTKKASRSCQTYKELGRWLKAIITSTSTKSKTESK